jgi:glucose-1-phosphate adenylyltransferase
MAKYMQDTVMLGADFYETDAEAASLLAEGRVPIGIGENTKIKYKQLETFNTNTHTHTHSLIFLPFLFFLMSLLLIIMCRECIIDKNARIGKNVVIANSEVGFFNII